VQANANIDLKWTLRSQPAELAFRGGKRCPPHSLLPSYQPTDSQNALQGSHFSRGQWLEEPLQINPLAPVPSQGRIAEAVSQPSFNPFDPNPPQSPFVKGGF